MLASSFAPVEGRRRSLHPISLRFTDSRLERRYRDDRLGFRFNAVRVATIAGTAIWLLFTLLNSFTIRDPSQPLLFVRIADGG